MGSALNVPATRPRSSCGRRRRELPQLVLVAADDEDVVPVGAQQLVDHARGPAEVPLGLLVHPVLDPVLGAGSSGVARLAQRIGDRFHLAHLVLVHLPDRGLLPVDDQDARAGVLAEHRQHPEILRNVPVVPGYFRVSIRLSKPMSP